MPFLSDRLHMYGRRPGCWPLPPPPPIHTLPPPPPPLLLQSRKISCVSIQPRQVHDEVNLTSLYLPSLLSALRPTPADLRSPSRRAIPAPPPARPASPPPGGRSPPPPRSLRRGAGHSKPVQHHHPTRHPQDGG